MFDLRILTDENIEKIVNGAFRVMENVGVDVYNEKALGILKELGCDVNVNRVKIPKEIVKKALETVPSHIKVYNRNGDLAMDLGGTNSYYGSGPTCTNFMDPYTGERRVSTKQDAADASIVADYLPNEDYVMSLTMIDDCTTGLADIHEVDAMVRNTTKPIATWAFTAENCQRIIDMCAAVRGGLKELQEKPYVIIYAEPTTPLTHGKEALDKLMVMAENKVPAIYAPGMLLGGTAPITLAGAMTVGISEALSGIVIHQAVCPGAPIIASCGGDALDMRVMKSAYGSPELMLAYGASSQVFRHLGVPTFGLAGATDAKVVDAQAGFESALQIFMNEATGANLIHDIGFMDFGLTGSCQHMVMCDEIISSVRRLRQSFEVNEETLAFDTVAEVGPGGNFLGASHTFENFKTEVWYPSLSERRSYEEWAADGKKHLSEVVDEKVQEILKTHKVPELDSEIIEKLDAIIAESEAKMKENK